MDKIEIITTYVKLVNYLTKNQLVQANAMTQRMENQIKDDFNLDAPETHPLFDAYKIIKKIQQQVVLGNTEKALIFVDDLRICLADKPDMKQTMSEVKKSLGD